MITTLHNLQNTHRPKQARKRVGRGIGSGTGKTAGRGGKGASARAGYKRRQGYEGGQFRLFMKLPERGFSNERFRTRLNAVNLWQIEQHFENGETVNMETLRERGLIQGDSFGIKLLAQGELTKKVSLEVHAISKQAAAKLEQQGISVTVIKSE